MHINPHKYQLEIKKENGQTYVKDIIRNKLLVYTPEEMVRQYVLHYLIEERKYPRTLISVEKGLNINGLTKRYDIAIFNRDGQPKVLIECKAPAVKLTNTTFEQAANYNKQLNVDFMIISNGGQNIVAELDYNQHEFKIIDDIPVYNEEFF